jgi:hypothetical protein
MDENENEQMSILKLLEQNATNIILMLSILLLIVLAVTFICPQWNSSISQFIISFVFQPKLVTNDLKLLSKFLVQKQHPDYS